MIETLHWGIVGCGNVSGDFSNALFYTAQNHVISAVAARDLNKAKQFAESHGFKEAKAYGSYTELFKDEVVGLCFH